MAAIDNNPAQRPVVDSNHTVPDEEPPVGQWPRIVTALFGVAAGGAIGFMFPGKKEQNALIGAVVGLVVGLGVYQAAKKKIDGWFGHKPAPAVHDETSDHFIGPKQEKHAVQQTPKPVDMGEKMPEVTQAVAPPQPPSPPPAPEAASAPTPNAPSSPPAPTAPIVQTPSGPPPNPEVGSAADAPAGAMVAGDSVM